MDKVVIINVFGFVSFHVCKTMLNKGIEVRGIKIENGENKSDYTEDMKLEIGRNANFKECSLEAWVNNPPEYGAITLMSLYDLYMTNNERIIQENSVMEPIMKHLKKSKDMSGMLALLIPSQLLSTELSSPVEVEMRNFLNILKGLNSNIQYIYLPTVYGPWQPSTFVFQHSIISKLNRNTDFGGIREETRDALFVNDTVDSIMEILESKKQGSYLLESGKENQWTLCAEFLKIEGRFLNVQKSQDFTKSHTRIIVKQETLYSDALLEQVNHTNRIYRV
ncbi:hypothetical protein [Bacillus sp. MRMR6]|uniref:hypothetical protein n=1 Tax=Bacillus sp. MRMR6 TaxID=1928617 RepID=UPI0009519AFF|nr:hypothetical protein [Bacillus sp. MRMR6]OLS41798.1 hypothetical protein BTR25_00030 [Bacillus sp. MRMR6]